MSHDAVDGTRAPGGVRIPLLTPEEMSGEQRTIHDDVLSGPRGQMIGPLRAAIHSPALARVWSALGEFLRYGTQLPKSLNELAIITTGRRWSSAIEWWVHSRAALAEGIDPAVIAAIRDDQAPSFNDRAQWEVYEYTRQLQQNGNVEAGLHAALLDRHGTAGIVELTAVIGYYTMVAMTLNAHELPLPDGVRSDLSQTNVLATLKAGLLVDA